MNVMQARAKELGLKLWVKPGVEGEVWIYSQHSQTPIAQTAFPLEWMDGYEAGFKLGQRSKG